MKAKKKAIRTSTRTKSPVKPKPKLLLTDRMKAQGVRTTLRRSEYLCACGSRMITNGTTAWCIRCDFA